MPPQIRCVYTAIVEDVIKGDFEDRSFMKFVFEGTDKITVEAYDIIAKSVVEMKKSMLMMPVKTLPENIIGVYTVNGTRNEVRNVKYAGKKNHINAIGCAFIEAHQTWNKLNS